jgi:hypothetical protein
MTISRRIFLGVWKSSDEFAEKIKREIFICKALFFFESPPVCEIITRNMAQPEDKIVFIYTQQGTKYMLRACWVMKEIYKEIFIIL